MHGRSAQDVHAAVYGPCAPGRPGDEVGGERYHSRMHKQDFRGMGAHL